MKTKEMKKRETRGITLIALVVTIVVLLILAGTAIAMLTGDSGIMTNAQKAKMSTELAGYKEEVELYKAEKYMENIEFEETSLTAGKENLFYNTQESGETGNIKTIIPDISDKYLEKLEIIKEHINLAVQEKGEIAVKELRKHIAWYTKNLKNSSEFRNSINIIETKEELLEKLEEYFKTL